MGLSQRVTETAPCFCLGKFPLNCCLHFVLHLSAILLAEKLDFAKIQLFVQLFGRKMLAKKLTAQLSKA
jgi:hypothetical protein